MKPASNSSVDWTEKIKPVKVLNGCGYKSVLIQLVQLKVEAAMIMQLFFPWLSSDRCILLFTFVLVTGERC